MIASEYVLALQVRELTSPSHSIVKNPTISNYSLNYYPNPDIQEMARVYIEMSAENIREAEEFLRIEINDWPE